MNLELNGESILCCPCSYAEVKAKGTLCPDRLQYKLTDRLTFYILALQGTLCLFRLALWGYSDVLLPQALRFHSQSFYFLRLCTRNLGRFAPSRFMLHILSCLAPSGFTLAFCLLRSCTFCASHSKK